MEQFPSFEEFWRYYLKRHSHKGNRLAHFVGAIIGLFSGLVALMTWNGLYLVIGLGLSYAVAWYGHFFLEKNQPTTLKHPFRSLKADATLFRLMLTRGLKEEIKSFRSL